MADSGLRIPSGLMEVVELRQLVWDQYNLSISNQNELDKLRAEIALATTGEEITEPLTQGGEPPDELAEALNLVQAELQKQADIKAEIAQCKISIHEEQARIMRNKIITVAVVVLILLAIGYFIVVMVS